jgi:hypothetical protein
MSLFTSAIDTYATKSVGENGHAQFAPVTCGSDVAALKERIVQFQFQIVRTTGIDSLAKVLRSLLTDLTASNVKENRDLLVVLYKIIGQTRDIEAGKGERDLAYMMIHVWFDFFPALAKGVLRRFVLSDSAKELPYGSWKDIKRFCQYVYLREGDEYGLLIEYCVELMCDQLRLDSAAASDSLLSLCARWVPRESSKKGRWLFRSMAATYFPEFLATAQTSESLKKARNKTYMKFGRMIADLNRRLDTLQIKMCGKTWAEIDHHKTPSVALMKNRAALMNKGKKRGAIDDDDRVRCAEAFESYINSRVSNGEEVKGKRVGIVDFVKNGLSPTLLTLDQTVLNAQWNSFLSQVGDLGNMVAMVDQSGSMCGDPYHAAVGLGIAIASRSALGPRIMTFSTEPAWVTLPVGGDFISCLRAIKLVDHLAGLGTNFFKALKLILDACVSASVPDSVVCNMTLAILSDMQIDALYNRIYNDNNRREGSFSDQMMSMHERIRAMYSAAGYSGVPHILFWNLRHTGGFPTLSSLPGATMFSGFSPMLLNAFCSKGREALASTTPWDALIESLDNPRYLVLERDMLSSFSNDSVKGSAFGREDWDPEIHHGGY